MLAFALYLTVTFLIMASLLGVFGLLRAENRDTFRLYMSWSFGVGALGAVLSIIVGLFQAPPIIDFETVRPNVQTDEMLGLILLVIFLFSWIWLELRGTVMKIFEFALFVILLIIYSIMIGSSIKEADSDHYREATYSLHQGSLKAVEMNSIIHQAKAPEATLGPENSDTIHYLFHGFDFSTCMKKSI